MDDTTSIIVTIVTVGVAIAAVTVPSLYGFRKEMRADFAAVKNDIAGLRERMARLEGLFDGHLRKEQTP